MFKRESYKKIHKKVMKKFLLLLITAIAIVASIPMLGAFESHVINVIAGIENALTVSSSHIDFGTVYPQMEVDKQFTVRLSDTFLNDQNVNAVDYIIRQKPKCAITLSDGKEIDLQFTATGHIVIDSQGNARVECGAVPRELKVGEKWEPLPLLCRYLSKHKQVSEAPENDTELPSFHDIGYVDNKGTPNDATDDTWVWTEVGGKLIKADSDTSDTWVLDLKTPCFNNQCAQDWANFVHRINVNADPGAFIQPNENEKKIFGCDVSIEITRVGVNEQPKTFCGDGIKQTPNEMGTKGPQNDGNEACDGSDGVTQGFTCTNNCELKKIPECLEGATQACNTGLLGICLSGTQTCTSESVWGACVQTNQPKAEICANNLDDDCDGLIDSADPDCNICTGNTDLMLVLDRSNSIDAGELVLLKTAAHSFVSSLNPAVSGNHIGQTNFSTYGHFDLHLTGNKTLIDGAIDSLVSGALTNLMEGITYASLELANTNITYERPDVPDFMIIITDGNPNRPINSTTARAQAKAAADQAKASGITIYAVGVGTDVDANYLKNDIATDAAHYYPVANYTGLEAVLKNINVTSCN